MLVGVAVGVAEEPPVAPVSVEVVAGIATYQTSSRPWPFTCPAALSPEYVCSGQLLYVTSFIWAPFTVIDTVPSVPVTPDVALGDPVTVTGGQVARQPASHGPILPLFSGRK